VAWVVKKLGRFFISRLNKRHHYSFTNKAENYKNYAIIT